MHCLCVQNLTPDVVTYTTLMKALVRVDKYEKVPHCYYSMIYHNKHVCTDIVLLFVCINLKIEFEEDHRLYTLPIKVVVSGSCSF